MLINNRGDFHPREILYQKNRSSLAISPSYGKLDEWIHKIKEAAVNMAASFILI